MIWYRTFREIPANAARLSVPAVLYVIQNILLFEGVRSLSPTVYMVCSQSKILTSAFFSAVLLRARLTLKQFFSLCALTFGMVLVERNGVAEKDSADRRLHTSFTGITAVFTASAISGFVGAYLERMFKESRRDGFIRSVWFRNVQLACFSVPVALLTAFFRDGEYIRQNGWLAGYDGVVVIIVMLHAIGGLVVAAVMRYASNVLKCFAVSLSICICTIISACIFDDVNDGMQVQQMCGIFLVIIATFAYRAK